MYNVEFLYDDEIIISQTKKTSFEKISDKKQKKIEDIKNILENLQVTNLLSSFFVKLKEIDNFLSLNSKIIAYIYIDIYQQELDEDLKKSLYMKLFSKQDVEESIKRYKDYLYAENIINDEEEEFEGNFDPGDLDEGAEDVGFEE